MPQKIPEYILRNMFIKESLQPFDDGFTFELKNTYAPARITGIRLTDGSQEIQQADLQLQLKNDTPKLLKDISRQTPCTLPVGQVLYVIVQQHTMPKMPLRISVDTREFGTLSFSIHESASIKKISHYPRKPITKRIFNAPVQAQAVIQLDDVIGEINPRIYGHFVEHLENCVYGGVFTSDGREMNTDVVDMVKALDPAVIRYPGGNFANGYHWEQGVGPMEQRTPHYDPAWNTEEPNRVGTDEFIDFCNEVGAEPYLVINDGSGTPEEAARWVAYCNELANTEMGAKRAANGHYNPYQVKLWGLGNEVWGDWQIGHTSAGGYTKRILPFIEAMRAVDPGIELVAVGLDHLAGDPRGAEAWNRIVLEGIGDQINYLSCHLYQPDESGYREQYDPETLYHSIVSAPHSAEDVIQRMATQIQQIIPNREIGIALDEYNVKFPPPVGSQSMHDLTYTLRDGLYVAGMLNAFHRQCNHLQVANIAFLVNTLPVIVKPSVGSAFPTPLYFPYKLYRQMEKQVLDISLWSPYFQAEKLGLNIISKDQVPYIDITATRSEDGKRIVLGVINRHPDKSAKLMLHLKGDQGKKRYRSTQAWAMTGSDPLAANTIDTPESVGVRRIKPPSLRFAWMDISLRPASLMVLTLER